MPHTFYPEDNEWASATGANVYSGGNTSQFDYPPLLMYDMSITTDEDDDDPFVFDIGDTVDLTYTVAGFTVSMEDAVVIRSDAVGDDAGVIVFEGMNNFGQIEHMAWTPNFDLESWYWDNFSGGQPPGFWVVDTDGAYDHSLPCFAAETRLDTPTGPTMAGSLSTGDLVETLDSGPVPIRWVGRIALPGVGRATPIEFLPGAIGNRSLICLSQQHRIMLQSAEAHLFYDAPEVLVPAKAAVNGTTVRYRARSFVEYVHLLLDRHEVILAGGALVESLLMGKISGDLIGDTDVPEIFQDPEPMKSARPILTFREAKSLLSPQPAPHEKLTLF